jgi:hypothetical protein
MLLPSVHSFRMRLWSYFNSRPFVSFAGFGAFGLLISVAPMGLLPWDYGHNGSGICLREKSVGGTNTTGLNLLIAGACLGYMQGQFENGSFRSP